MAQINEKYAKRRMDARFERLQAMCARTYNVGKYDPLSEAAVALEKLLDATPSEQELADIVVLGSTLDWRREYLDFILLARSIANDGFVIPPKPDPDWDELNADPKWWH